MSIIKLDGDTYFSTLDGIVISKEQALQIIKKAVKRKKNLTINQTVNKIHGVDLQTIPLQVASRDGVLAANDGFLVQVFLSASDGSLSRLYQSEILDPASDVTIRGSYDQFITLEVDV